MIKQPSRAFRLSTGDKTQLFVGPGSQHAEIVNFANGSEIGLNGALDLVKVLSLRASPHR